MLALQSYVTGYLHPDYIRSLSEFGEPVLLPRSGGWLLKRAIDRAATDAMGTYPLFACSDWRSLSTDFDEVCRSLVSIVVVTDPFGEYDEPLLHNSFDLVIPFKSHFVRDLNCSQGNAMCEHHVRNTRIGLKRVNVELCENPSSGLEDWIKLYSILIHRHRISGIRAFSASSFAVQLRIPGIVCFRALREKETVGMTLWYLQNGIAYYHLGAYSDEGYRLRASFALFSRAFDYFASCRLKYVNLGAGAGLDDHADDGLTRFKRGWSTVLRQTYLCGRIVDRTKYDHLVRTREIGATDYFPAYRKGEFS